MDTFGGILTLSLAPTAGLRKITCNSLSFLRSIVSGGFGKILLEFLTREEAFLRTDFLNYHHRVHRPPDQCFERGFAQGECRGNGGRKSISGAGALERGSDVRINRHFP